MRFGHRSSSSRDEPAGAERPACASKKLCPVETQSTSESGGPSSSAGGSSAPSSPRSSKFSFSALHDAVSRGTQQTSKHDQLPPYHLVVPTDPVHLVEKAISLVLSVPGPPIEQLRTELVPKLYHSAYSHRVNCREHGVEELVALAKRFRERFQSVRIRFRSHLMDMDGTATMHAAAVAITYDIIALPFPSPGQGKHEVHEKRGSAVGVHKIYEGRLAQTDLVVDTAEFQSASDEGPQLTQCSVM
ncbi:hypothetical protein JCM10213_007967 [Rhodosporidiobolus nylandii]